MALKSNWPFAFVNDAQTEDSLALMKLKEPSQKQKLKQEINEAPEALF
jgi:hypothetical protein